MVVSFQPTESAFVLQARSNTQGIPTKGHLHQHQHVILKSLTMEVAHLRLEDFRMKQLLRPLVTIHPIWHTNDSQLCPLALILP
jgi:hypothetical protein